jgi:hypothetical protein
MKKKKTIYIALLLFCGVVSKSQSISIQLDSFKSESNYSVNIVRTVNKKSSLNCYVINFLNSGIEGNKKRLYVFKVFTNRIVRVKKGKSLLSQIDSLNTVYTSPEPAKRKELKIGKPNLQKTIVEFHSVKNKIDELLELNKLINVDLTSQSIGNDYQMVFDNLSLATKDSVYYFDGSVLLQYFSLYDFEQITPLQSSQTLINTRSIVTILTSLTSVTGNPADSIFLYPDFAKYDYNIYRKMYLTKIINSENDPVFIFCRLILKKGFDDFLNQTEFFTYKPKIGINGFRGIYVYKNGPSAIIARFSDKILEFEAAEFLNFER